MEAESHGDVHALQDIEIKERLLHIQEKIIVMSGKGGVGKSSIAAYLSVALAKRGYKVGLMDVDLHGPSIPRLLGLKGTIGPGVQPGKAKPIAYIPNMEVISIESLMGEDKDKATIWRGPIKIGVIRQFISDIEWEDLDYLIIDSPPGTGDEPLTVAQTIHGAKAIIVTTPQEISLSDVRKSINFCRHVNMEILGLVENMSGLTCPHCGQTIELFKTKGGMLTAKKEGLVLLGTLPFQPEVVEHGDSGNIAILEQKDRPFAKAFDEMLEQIIRQLEIGRGKRSQRKEERLPKRRAGNGEGMMVVLPVSEGKLSSHFGHCDQFAFIKTKDGKIEEKEMRMPPPHEPGVLPRWLHEQGADVVIAGGMGEKAKQLLREMGVEVVVGAPMDSPESLVNQYLANALVTGENVCDH